MTQPRWLDAREAHLWRSYLTLHRELKAALDVQLVRDSGLSGADYAILAALSDAPDGIARTRDLGCLVGWERSRLSHQVSRMEKRGLVAREECETDARGSMVRLTEAGRAAVEAAAPKHVATVRAYLFDPLSRVEQDTLTELMDRILAGLPADRP